MGIQGFIQGWSELLAQLKYHSQSKQGNKPEQTQAVEIGMNMTDKTPD